MPDRHALREAPTRSRTISANVRRLATLRALPLAWLADLAGVGRTTLWRLLDVHHRGPSDPRLSTLEALAAALDVDVTELLRPEADPFTNRSPTHVR